VLTDFSAAREVAVYEFELAAAEAAEAADAATKVADARVRRVTTVFCLPNYRGVLGTLRRAQANFHGALAERVVGRRTAYALLMLLVGPLCIPALGAYWWCALRGRRAAKAAKAARTVAAAAAAAVPSAAEAKARKVD